MVNVSWYDAISFCNLLSKECGLKGYRYGGIENIAWYDENSEGRIHEVGKKELNNWGLYDMLGNTWESPASYGIFFVSSRHTESVAGIERIKG